MGRHHDGLMLRLKWSTPPMGAGPEFRGGGENCQVIAEDLGVATADAADRESSEQDRDRGLTESRGRGPHPEYTPINRKLQLCAFKPTRRCAHG